MAPPRPLHPAHRLGCWLLAVIAIQSLAGPALAAAFAVVPLCGRRVLARWGRLAWRARWLLLSLLAVLAWGVAGEPVRDGGGALVPTWEGLAAGATQLGRLLLVLAAVALLLETTPVDRLMAGCHVLLRPFAALRLDVDRAVVRLSLALHYAGRMPKGGWKHLLEPDPAAEAPTAVTLVLPPAALADWLALAAALAVAATALAA